MKGKGEALGVMKLREGLRTEGCKERNGGEGKALGVMR